MNTVPGHLYRVSVALSTGAPKDSSWLAGPLTATYPADVVSITSSSASSASAVLRWTGAAGALNPGDRITINVPGLVDLQGVAPEASVTSVDDLGPTAISAPRSAAWNVVAAVGILATVLLLTHRLKAKDEERRAA
jgi:hypothetical protein